MTAIQLNAALHRELSFIVTDSTMMERALKSLRKIRKEWKAEHKFIDPEIAKIPEEYRCDPYETSPSGDPFFADKRNVEYVRKRLEEPVNEDELITIHGHEELDKFLESL